MAGSPLVCTFGMFILDQFRYEDICPSDASVNDRITEQIGGGGTYTTVGARMFLSPSKLLMIVDRGHDWKHYGWVQEKLDSYGAEAWHYREDTTRETTKALNIYRLDGSRGFQYLTPRRRLSPLDLLSLSPPLPSLPRFLHFICSPTRALTIISEISSIRGSSSTKYPNWDPVLVYEPIPDCCTPEELASLQDGIKKVAVFSPNHLEAANFFFPSSQLPFPSSSHFREVIEEVAERFVNMGLGTETTRGGGDVVVRCGEHGAFVRRRDGKKAWIAPYWTSLSPAEEKEKIVDVTGAGNGFLGGLMAAFAKQLEEGNELDIFHAVRAGSVSASFIIQQYGLPALSQEEGGAENWGDLEPRSAERRLEEMRCR
ncbi:Ribokinase-like protein [Atractiella rhizophila]|nr:Ribokinase-like protein [Atractiella rhizophila]